MQTLIEETAPPNGSQAWARVFATIYNPMLWAGERAGAHALRKQVIENARGRTVEIGAGTGINVPLYGRDVEDLILAEPDASMRSRLERKVRRSVLQPRVIDAPAELLPFADASVDTVLSTFVLCTVDDPERVLREVARVLRPDGQLLFVEHVRSDSPTLARWQDRLEKPWRAFARGCRCNRATEPLIASCGFAFDNVEYASWHIMPPIIRPLIAGRARIGDDK
jgi:ubiquinone/menaquinone biosynthesis C-methylase UbiE